MAAALVLYPNNTLNIPVNVNDRIEVTYDTAWPQTNLTMLCRAATSSIYVYYNMPDNPLAARGAYLTPSIQSMKFGIQQWPADCLFRLTRYGNDSVIGDGTRFTLTSSADVKARTFMISSTIGLSTTTASTATTTASTTSAVTTTTASSSTGQAQQTGNSSQSSDSTSQGLSKAASAGIGAGVAFGVLLIVAGIVAFIFHTRRRKRNQRSPPLASGFGPGKGGYNYNYAKAEVQGDSPDYPAPYGATTYDSPGDGRAYKDSTRINIGDRGSQLALEKDGVQRVEADAGYKGPQQGYSSSPPPRRHELA